MRTTRARVLIVAILLLEVIWFVMPRTGSQPLSPAAQAAAVACSQNPSEAARAKLDAALEADTSARGLQSLGLMGLVVVLDAIGIYCFWNHGHRRSKKFLANNSWTKSAQAAKCQQAS
jgi:hypothetical protein